MVKAAPKPQLSTVVTVAVGGIIGALARVYLPWPVLSSPEHVADPLPSLIVNIVGAMLLGFITGYSANRSWPEPLEKGLTVGVLGSFTTMSALALAASVILSGQPVESAGFTLGILGLGVLSTVALIGFLALTTVATLASYRYGRRRSAA